MDRIKNIKHFFKKIFFFKKETSAYGCRSSFIVNRKYYYKKSPYELYIKDNIDYLLFLCIKWFRKNKIKTKIGVEIEFYSYNFIDKNIIFDFCNKNNIKIIDFEKERGNNQFEIKLFPYKNLKKLIIDYNKLKNFLISELYCDFNAFSKNSDVGSALQINISLLDKDNINLFYKNINILKNSVAGILETINMFLNFYSKNLYRYDYENNSKLYSIGLIPAPSFISWGYNNRTCAIRIPDTKISKNDELLYLNEIKNNKRIEFRVPSSDSDLKFVLYCVLNSIIYGIDSKLMPIDETYNNVFKNNENYVKIENTFCSFSDYYNLLNVLY